MIVRTTTLLFIGANVYARLSTNTMRIRSASSGRFCRKSGDATRA